MLIAVFLLCFCVCLYVCCTIPLFPATNVCAHAWLLVFLLIVFITTPFTAFIVYIFFFILPMFLLHLHSVHTFD
ncbi:putative protein E5 [human papillomavirus 85]|uniref:Uncharacterized protein n=1 Tax=human papillomavirus 85 TaxID=2848423 RepID=Q9WHG5_9PAPI|nr:putative protein E5 [human papillomavirus 85]